MNKKIGLIIGKFLPLHNGHLFFINKSATQVDKLYVIVDEHPVSDKQKCIEAGMKYPNLLTRTKWLTSVYKDTPHIEIVGMSEEGIRPYPNGWKDWSERVVKTIGEKFTHIFTSDQEYKDGYTEHFPWAEQVFYDQERRETNGLSATRVRNDLLGNWHNMPSVVRKFFTKKIVVVGGESTGKTTLVKAMSKVFATSWSEEYGRTFCEKELGAWYDKNQMILTNKKDYETIVINQSIQNDEAIRTANKFTIIDTDAIYTQNFYELQFGEKNDLVEEFIKKQRREFIYIYLSDEVPFVQDNFRVKKNRDKVKDYYKQYINEFDYEIYGETYLERFDKMFEILTKESNDINPRTERKYNHLKGIFENLRRNNE